MIDGNKIHRYLKRDIPVLTYDLIDSTNEAARRYLKDNPCERAVFTARGQYAGKGRLGRSFFSPADTGIYMTYVFRVDEINVKMLRVTTAASVAAARALDCKARIKWVNDLYLNGKKICGILTETVSMEYKYILVGIGINLTTADFPEDIRGKAGSLGSDLDKEKIIAEICDRLSQTADDLSSEDYLEYYRNNMTGIGETIKYIENGEEHIAVIEGVGSLGELIVTENNREKRLCSGEISIHFSGADTGGTYDL